jgi:hypothetical protein
MTYVFPDGKLTKTDSAAMPANKPEFQASESLELKLDLISEQNDRWIFALKFDLVEERLNMPGKSTVLLDQLIGVRATEPILIGFPYSNPRKGKFIYWVALYAEMTGV